MNANDGDVFQEAYKRLKWTAGSKEGMLARKTVNENGLSYEWADPEELERLINEVKNERKQDL